MSDTTETQVMEQTAVETEGSADVVEENDFAFDTSALEAAIRSDRTAAGEPETTGEGGDGGDDEPEQSGLKNTEEQKAVEDEFGEAPGPSEKSKSGWAKLKEAKKAVELERDTFKGELESLKSELERLKSEPRTAQNSEDIAAIRAELESTKKKAEEYESRVALLDVESTDEYQQNIAIPLRNAEETIQQYVSAYELNLEDIAKAAMAQSPLERNKLLAEIVGGMNDFDKLEFKKVVDDARLLWQRQIQVRENAKESLKYVEEQRKLAAEAENKKLRETYNAEADSVWGSLTKRLPWLSEDKAVAERLNNDARNIDIGTLTPKEKAFAAYASVALPSVIERYEKQISELSKELGTYKERVTKTNSAQPATKTGAPVREVEEEKSFEEGLKNPAFWRS